MSGIAKTSLDGGNNCVQETGTNIASSVLSLPSKIIKGVRDRFAGKVAAVRDCSREDCLELAKTAGKGALVAGGVSLAVLPNAGCTSADAKAKTNSNEMTVTNSLEQEKGGISEDIKDKVTVENTKKSIFDNMTPAEYRKYVETHPEYKAVDNLTSVEPAGEVPDGIIHSDAIAEHSPIKIKKYQLDGPLTPENLKEIFLSMLFERPSFGDEGMLKRYGDRFDTEILPNAEVTEKFINSMQNLFNEIDKLAQENPKATIHPLMVEKILTGMFSFHRNMAILGPDFEEMKDEQSLRLGGELYNTVVLTAYIFEGEEAAKSISDVAAKGTVEGGFNYILPAFNADFIQRMRALGMEPTFGLIQACSGQFDKILAALEGKGEGYLLDIKDLSIIHQVGVAEALANMKPGADEFEVIQAVLNVYEGLEFILEDIASGEGDKNTGLVAEMEELGNLTDGIVDEQMILYGKYLEAKASKTGDEALKKLNENIAKTRKEIAEYRKARAIAQVLLKAMDA